MSFNKLDATVFVYRSRIDGRIHAEYIDTAREMDKSPDWEHIATLEPRLWIQHNYAASQPQPKQEPVAWTSTAALKNAATLGTADLWLEFDPDYEKNAAESGWDSVQIPLYTKPQPQPKQEPVAWINEDQTIGPDYGKKHYSDKPYYSLNPLRYKHTPLYATPQPQHDDSLTAAYMLGRADDTALLRQALGVLEKLNKDGWILADFEQEVWTAITTLKERLK